MVVDDKIYSRFRLKGDLKKHITTVHHLEFHDTKIRLFDDRITTPPIDPSTGLSPAFV